MENGKIYTTKSLNQLKFSIIIILNLKKINFFLQKKTKKTKNKKKNDKIKNLL